MRGRGLADLPGEPEDARTRPTGREGGDFLPFEEWVAAHARVSSKPHKGLKLDDTLSFFHQLSTLISSGTPLLDSLRLAGEQNQSVKLRNVMAEITAKVAAGSSFHQAAAIYPKVFQHHWVEIIRTGELTGKMASVLQELNKQIREARDTRKKVVASLSYPVVLIIVAVIAVTVLLATVVPTFAGMFKDMGAELPAITQYVVDLSGFIVKYGLYIGVTVGIAIFGIKTYGGTEAGRRNYVGVGLVLPMIGELIVMMAMYRFASNIALLLKAGVPMLETLTVLRGVFDTSPIFRDALTRAQNRVAAGRPLADSLIETKLFTPMMTNLVHIGEESGKLAAVMEEIAPYYKEKMQGLITGVTKLLEPIIIMGMGSTIGGLMLAIYLPMFEMSGKVK
jgi:type IV pilus assembly protein PilC